MSVGFLWSSPLKAELQLSKKNKQALFYLKALTAERKGGVNSAKPFYNMLEGTANVQERLFTQAIPRYPLRRAPTVDAFVYQLRFLWYQGEVKSALKLVRINKFSSPSVDLEIARLLLSAGDLEAAGSLLKTSSFKTEDLTIEALELRAWKHFLANEPKQLKQVKRSLTLQRLYLPTQTFPGAMETASLRQLERWLLLFPSSKPLNNEVSHRYWDLNQWENLDQLCQTNRRYELPRPTSWVCRFAQQMKKGSGYRQIKAALGGRFETITMVHKLAERSIDQQDWKTLRQIATYLSDVYPNLPDGAELGRWVAAKER